MPPPMTPAGDAAEQVSAFWSKAAEPDYREKHAVTNWMGASEVQKHLNLACSGKPDRSYLDYFCDTYLVGGRRVHEVINLGCGEGALEQWLLARDFADSYVGYDISAKCIERATEVITKEHPRAKFVCADLNHAQLPRAAFDVAFFSHSLHHIENLEHICAEVRRALRPDGFLLVHEFVGPSRMQWTDKQLEICNLLLDQFAPHLREDISQRPARVPRGRIERMTKAEWLRCDPSECVRSSDILSVLPTEFEILERRDFGGTILQKLLENVVGNLQESNADHQTIIRLLIAFETVLLREGVLPSDFTFIVARPRIK